MFRTYYGGAKNLFLLLSENVNFEQSLRGIIGFVADPSFGLLMLLSGRQYNVSVGIQQRRQFVCSHWLIIGGGRGGCVTTVMWSPQSRKIEFV